MAYRLIPADKAPKNITRASYRNSAAYKEHFLEYSKVIMADAVESIAKVWLHAWVRYRDWFRGTELAYLNEQLTKATNNLNNANLTIDTYDTVKAALQEKIDVAQASVDKKQAVLDEAKAKGNKTEKKEEELHKAEARLAKALENLDALEKAYADATASLDNLKALLISAQINYDAKDAEIKRYEDSNSGI
jgi:DNA repair exonuclease SbcCD ATPase subunit